MPRSVTLFTGQWADLPLDELAARCAGWGFDGLELACWGDHFEVDKAIADAGYAKGRRALLERNGLNVWAIGAHLVGQAVCDRIDERHRAILPPDGFGGSPIWHLIYSFPPNDFAEIDRAYEEFAERWGPIMDVFASEGVKFGLEVHPTEIAYDFITTLRLLDAIDN